MPIDLDEFKRNLEASLKRNREAFEGRYSEQLHELLGVSEQDLARVSPNPETSKMDYNNLISVVKEASRANVSQATLRSQIKSLGAGAVEIAKLVGGLAGVVA
jgi:hypothetical protein